MGLPFLTILDRCFIDILDVKNKGQAFKLRESPYPYALVGERLAEPEEGVKQGISLESWQELDIETYLVLPRCKLLVWEDSCL